MLRRRNARTRMRPWIAVVAAYALALQVVLTAVAVDQSISGGDAAASSLFVICHGDSSSDKQDLPDKGRLAHSPCILCTLAKASCAILPTGPAIAISDAMRISNATPRADRRIIEFNSPTGQYQRGPPVSISIFG
jgi:Protein of unknown function (DUF2946)